MLLRLLLIFGFIYFCYGLECSVVSGRTKPACNCHIYENGSFTFECPVNLSKSTYLEELDDLEEALTIKFPGNNCNGLPKECKCEGKTFETISIECPPSAFYDVIESIHGFYMYDLQFICTDEEKMPKRITQFPKFWTRSIGFIGCGIEEFGDDTFWNIRGLLFVTLSHNKLKKIGNALLQIRDLRYAFLDGNELKHIERGMFSQSIETINLNGNPIEKIDDDAFDELKSLEELRLPLFRENIIPDGLFKTPIQRLIIRGVSNQNEIICSKWFINYLLFNGINLYFEEWFSQESLYCSENGFYGGQKLYDVLKDLSKSLTVTHVSNPSEEALCSSKTLKNLMVHQDQKIYQTMTPMEYIMEE